MFSMSDTWDFMSCFPPLSTTPTFCSRLCEAINQMKRHVNLTMKASEVLITTASCWIHSIQAEDLPGIIAYLK